jgi:nitroimidazol reductase NimA-like FMN-containing flavoprotein (pyridoxamine 5'-phosphate oxidase superfamily)
MCKKILEQKSKGTANVPQRLKIIDQKQRHAVLATVSGKRPYTSLVAFALTPDASGLLFATPKKTQKYRNIVKNKNVSLLINTAKNTSKDYNNAEAVTIQGEARILSGKKRTVFAGMLAGKHPHLKSFINSATTALVMVKTEYCLHVNRFQQVTEWSLRGTK